MENYINMGYGYMDLLSGTPYVLDQSRASHILKAAEQLEENVQLLRREGALDKTTLDRLRLEWGFKQVHESTAIEGNELTLNETQIAIQRGITISGKPPAHSAEVQNLHRALQYVDQIAKQESPLTEREIRELQAMIVGNDRPDRGSYRKIEVAISNSPHKPPHPVKVPEDMSSFASWIAGECHLPVPLLCAVSHAWLVHIHPFSDGNGRTARAVSNLQLIRAGYPIVVIRRKDRQRYYEALRASDDSDITPFFELVVERCRDSLLSPFRHRGGIVRVLL